MQITITLGEPLWRKPGTRRLTLEFPQTQVTLAEALHHLMERCPSLRDDLNPDRHGAPQALPCHLFVNHRKIAWDCTDQVALEDGDRLALFLLVVGG